MNINKNEDIVTIIKQNGCFYWFSAFKEMWVLDRVNWMKTFISMGFKNFDPNDHSERYDIAIIGTDNCEKFISCLTNDGYLINKDDLANEFYERLSPDTKWWDIYDLLPDLFIDFDSCRLYSEFVEAMHYEWYAPDGWTGEFFDFCESPLLPLSEKFWIKNGIDHRREVISRG